MNQAPSSPQRPSPQDPRSQGPKPEYPHGPIAPPGTTDQPLIPSTMPPDRVKQFGAHTAFERAAQPVEIAPIFVFLASNEARFVSGEVYGATGGQTPV